MFEICLAVPSMLSAYFVAVCRSRSSSDDRRVLDCRLTLGLGGGEARLGRSLWTPSCPGISELWFLEQASGSGTSEPPDIAYLEAFRRSRDGDRFLDRLFLLSLFSFNERWKLAISAFGKIRLTSRIDDGGFGFEGSVLLKPLPPRCFVSSWGGIVKFHNMIVPSLAPVLTSLVLIIPPVPEICTNARALTAV